MFCSLLYCTEEQYKEPRHHNEPECFQDLNLGKVFTPLIDSKKEFHFEEIFYTPLHNKKTIIYRQNIMRELEKGNLRKTFASFSRNIYETGCLMNAARKAFNSKDPLENNYLVRGHMLNYAEQYCSTISELNDKIRQDSFHSGGLRTFAEYLTGYCKSQEYTELCSRVKKLRKELSDIKYCMLINNGTVRVRRYEEQEDFSTQILNVFDKFRQGDVHNYYHEIPEKPSAIHVEAAVLNLVARLYKDAFNDLNEFCIQYFHFDDDVIVRISREIQFYLIWLNYVDSLRQYGLSFNYPEICSTPDHLYERNGFDIVLAEELKEHTVTNDFQLDSPEHILVVTGPNQGGKTTYARMFGQIHYMASLGLCVPGAEASLYMFDEIYTHFGREEDLSTLNGKLKDDLVRLHAIFKRATSKSIIIVNEIYSSTTLDDALKLGEHMMDEIISLHAPSVIVTFLDELACYSKETVSMMSTVQENNPSKRTFKIVRKPPDGLAYAVNIAAKHGLTYEKLSRRIQHESKFDV